MMNHSPHDESMVDPHSGTRFVMVLFAIPLCMFVGWLALHVVRDLSQSFLDYEAAQRAGYAAGGIAMLLLAIKSYYVIASFTQVTPIDELPDDFPEDDIGLDD
jgi:hypothetical protein